MSGPAVAPGPPRGRGLQAAASRHPLVLVATGVVIYATGPVMVQASSASGPVFSFWRLWIGVAALGAVTAAYVAVVGRRPSRRGWGWAVRAGAAFGAHQLMFMSAIKLTSVVDVALMNTLAPVVVGVLAVPMFGEHPGPRFRAWSALAIAGGAVVAVGGAAGPEGDPAGMALAVGNIVAFALFFLWSKQARDDIDVVPFLFGMTVVAAVTVSAWVLATGAPLHDVDRRDLLLAAGVALGPGIAGHFVMTWPLRWVPANVPPVMRLAGPFLSGGLAWALLGEGIGWAAVAGGVVTVVGVAGALLAPGVRAAVRVAGLDEEG